MLICRPYLDSKGIKFYQGIKLKKETSILLFNLVLIISGYLSSSSSFLQTSRIEQNLSTSNTFHSANTNSKSLLSDPTLISFKIGVISKHNDLPETPILSPISPNPSTSAKVNLVWNDAIGAIDYFIYRSNSLITSTSGMIPLKRVSTTLFQDIINVSGIYYYSIVATNLEGNSSLSNCQNVSITIITSPIPQEILTLILTAGIGIIFFGLLVLLRRK